MLGTSRFQNINASELTLDIENPRIKKWIEYYEGEITPANIKLALGVGTGDEQSENGTTYQSLKESIRASGGINHPIIVNDNGKQKVVVEGNTRLAIYQEFKENGVPGNWDTIPAIVYTSLDPEYVEAIRLQSHLVGPRAWDPYSKAKYLHHLYNVEHMTVERIIAYCGGKKRDIDNYISAYQDMEKYYRPILNSDQDFDTTRFSGFVELQKPHIKEAIIKSGKSLEDFASWIDSRKIDPLSTVRQLPKILANPKSRNIFYEHGAREALKSLDSPNIDKLLSELGLSDMCRALQRAIDNLQYSKYKDMCNNVDDPDREAVLDLKEAYIQLVRDLEES